MFTITSARIVGLIAVVCAAIVAPQALAMPIIDSQDTTPTIIAPPGDAPRGLELGDLKNGRAVFTATTPDAVQGNDVSGFDLGDLKSGRAVFTAATSKNAKVPESQWRSPLGQPANNTPGGIVQTSKSGTAASTAAAIKALQRRSVALDAKYRKLYPGAYSQESAAALTLNTAPLGWFCFDQAKYEYVHKACE